MGRSAKSEEELPSRECNALLVSHVFVCFSPVSFSSLLHPEAYCRAGQVAEMEAVFVNMQGAPSSIAPDVHSYRCLIEGYAQGGLHQKLLRTVQHMVLLRYRAVPAAWNTALAALGKVGRD